MCLTYRETYHDVGMTVRQFMWLTDGQTGCLDGMTDRCVLLLTYGWTSCFDGTTDRQLM